MAEPVVCPSCYNICPADAEFCAKCGQSLGEARAAAQNRNDTLRFAAQLVLDAGSTEKAQQQIDTELSTLREKVRTTLSESTAAIPVPADNDWVREMMTNIGIDPSRESLTALEAYRLQYEMNRNTLYGGQRWNAKQVMLLQEPYPKTDEGRKALHTSYNAYYRSQIAGPWNGAIWTALITVGVVVFFTALPNSMPSVSRWTLIGSVGAIAYGYMRMQRVNAHWDGYYVGIGDGKRAGVVEALGITPDDKKSIEECAGEMENFEEQFPEFVA